MRVSQVRRPSPVCASTSRRVSRRTGSGLRLMRVGLLPDAEPPAAWAPPADSSRAGTCVERTEVTCTGRKTRSPRASS